MKNLTDLYSKEYISNLKTNVALGVLGTVAAVMPQTGISQERVIEEIVVSAQKKDENASDVPLTVTALTGETLDEMNVSNFDEYIEYLPNVTNGGRGPGQSTIYIRGMAVDPVNVFLSAAQGSTPNVALYLDEQPVTVPGRNLDIYVADMERIEVLPGPQGTLYGASSQAGTVRLITNKPKFNESEAGLNASIFGTSDGEASNNFDAFVNIPMIDDVWAVRGVFYRSDLGGYIDNVPGTLVLSPNNPSYPGPDTTYTEIDNASLVEDDFNDSSYQGFRLSSAMSLNDNWDLLVTHIDQEINADGVFDYDPAVGDLKVKRFQPDTLEDAFTQTSMTLEGRMGTLDVLYTGSYLDRQVNQLVDYSGYGNVGAYLPYYICNYLSLTSPSYSACGNADVLVELDDQNERTTHEFRIASNEMSELPFSYTAGVFIDESILKTINEYNYNGSISPEGNDSFGSVAQENCPIPGAYANDPSCRPAQTRFYNDILELRSKPHSLVKLLSLLVIS